MDYTSDEFDSSTSDMHARNTPDTSDAASETSHNANVEVDEFVTLQETSCNRRPPSLPPMARGGGQVALQTRLLHYLNKIPGHEEKKGFFSGKQIDDLMTEESVAAELQLCFKYLDATTIAGYSARICGTNSDQSEERQSFKKVFAILVLCEKPKAIPKFLEEEVSDQDLPLDKFTSSETSSNIFKLVRNGQSAELECFQGWTDTAVWRFEEWQWTTLAPSFRRSEDRHVEHSVFEDQIALPFIQDSRFPADRSPYQRLEFDGGFSNVFKVRIHPDHHNFCKSGVSLSWHGAIST